MVVDIWPRKDLQHIISETIVFRALSTLYLEFWSIPPPMNRCILWFFEPNCTENDWDIGDDDYSVSNNVVC